MKIEKFDIKRMTKENEVTENLHRLSEKSFVHVDGGTVVTLSVKKGNNGKVMATPQRVFIQDEAGEFVKETGAVTKEPRIEAATALTSYIAHEGLEFDFAEGTKRAVTKKESFLSFIAAKYEFDLDVERDAFNEAQEAKKATNEEIEAQIAALKASKL